MVAMTVVKGTTDAVTVPKVSLLLLSEPLIPSLPEAPAVPAVPAAPPVAAAGSFRYGPWKLT
jgi:hypothetical protein